MRVALPWLGYACGVCRYCNSGRETLCPEQLNMGYALNGSFAEYAIGYARHVVRVPDGVEPADAAPLTCAGVTTYKAVKVSGADSSSLVAVFGAGGLGHLAIQYARITGASVVAVDSTPHAWRPRSSSAPSTSSMPARKTRRRDPASRRRRRRDRDGCDPHRLRTGLRVARPRWQARLRRAAGREPHSASRSSRPCSAALDVRGSIVGTRHDLEEVFEPSGFAHRRPPSPPRVTSSTSRSASGSGIAASISGKTSRSSKRTWRSSADPRWWSSSSAGSASCSRRCAAARIRMWSTSIRTMHSASGSIQPAAVGSSTSSSMRK